jgi:PhnB protein
MTEFNATTQPQIYLTVQGGTDAIAFYKAAFNATEELLMMADDGTRVMHATLALLGGHIMLSDEFPEFGAQTKSPPALGGTSVTIHTNLADTAMVDAAMASAAAHGATITMPAEKMFWGDYYGRLLDPFGHSWSFATEMPPE